MQTLKLQEHKVKQAIKRYGVDYNFTRAKEDSFNQPIFAQDGTPETEAVATIRGLFHESGKTFVLITTDAAQIHNKPTPAVLAMFIDTEKLQTNDLVTISDLRYKVVAINNVGNLNLFADISLELIIDGVHV